MVILGNEELYLTPTTLTPRNDKNTSVAFYNGYMYVSNIANRKIYSVDLSDPAKNMVEFINFDVGGGTTVIKVYGNTLYVVCPDRYKIVSINLTSLPLQYNVIFDAFSNPNYSASDENFLNGFSINNGFAINNGYIYVVGKGLNDRSYIYCYCINTGIHTTIKIDVIDFSYGIGVYNLCLYMAGIDNLSIIRIPLTIANTNVILSAYNIEVVYTFDSIKYAGYKIWGFEIYYNNAIVIMSNDITSKLIHLDLDTLDMTEKTLSRSIGASSWPTVYNKYIYITCNDGADIIRVSTDFTSFKDSVIFINNGWDQKIKINCSQRFVGVDYLPASS